MHIVCEYLTKLQRNNQEKLGRNIDLPEKNGVYGKSSEIKTGKERTVLSPGKSEIK